MLGQGLADPDILAIVGPHEEYKVVPDGIVRVEEVRDYAQKAEAAREEDELIFLTQFVEDVLLELL